MSKYPNTTELAEAVAKAQSILIMQPDNPDGDSMGTALGLEEILGDLGKSAQLYSYNEPQNYLRIYEGWDRIEQKLPKAFDLGIIVDTASPSLISATLEHSAETITTGSWFVIDHHAERSDFGFNNVQIVDHEAASTGEMIVQLAQALDWPINERAADKLAGSILSDSLNLTVPATSASTVQALADLVKLGANLNDLYTRKREVSLLSPGLIGLKAQLLSKIEYYGEGRLAVCTIPADLVEQYKDEHNPSDLVMWDMQWITGVEVAAVLKDYGTKIKVSLRARKPYAAKIASQFGGGGHAMAAGYRAEGTDMSVAVMALREAFSKASKDSHETK